MHRCFIDNERWGQSPLIPSAEEAHHILHVLRARDGDAICIFNGAGEEAEAVLHLSADGAPPVLEALTKRATPPRHLEIVLLQAILKGNRMEMLIEKATELGVACIVPVITQRVIPRFDTSKARQKRDRWARVAVSAAKQCGTPWLPRIELPTPFAQAISCSNGPVLLGSLDDHARPLAAVIDELREKKPATVTAIIGPEGDFTEDEIHSVLATGAMPVSLGALTLRAETAAIYTISALACMLG